MIFSQTNSHWEFSSSKSGKNFFRQNEAFLIISTDFAIVFVVTVIILIKPQLLKFMKTINSYLNPHPRPKPKLTILGKICT